MQKFKQMLQDGLLLIPRFVLQDMSANSSEEKLAIVTFSDLYTGRGGETGLTEEAALV